MAWVIERHGSKGVGYMACYRDPKGTQRSAGTFPTRRAAHRAATREELKVNDGQWHDATLGKVTFKTYVDTVWLPSRHIEASTLAAYQSYLNKQFFPFFGPMRIGKVLPPTSRTGSPPPPPTGSPPSSIRKYHMMLHSVFKRAVRDRIITFNPCAETELPKVVAKRRRTLTPDEYQRLLTAVPDRYRLMVQTAIETGLRWGELIALRPRHLGLLHGALTVEETIVEVPLRAAPNRQRMITKAYPKDNEPRTIGLRPELLTTHIRERGIGSNDLLFATRDRTPISRNTFRTRAWTPAVITSGIDFNVRIHDLRHAHASWLFAGGLRPQIRHGPHGPHANPNHPEIPPRPPRRRQTKHRRLHPHRRPNRMTPRNARDLDTRRSG